MTAQRIVVTQEYQEGYTSAKVNEGDGTKVQNPYIRGTTLWQRWNAGWNDYEELKNWDITFVSYRSEIVRAKSEEEAWAIAKEHQEPEERISVIEETDEGVSE